MVAILTVAEQYRRTPMGERALVPSTDITYTGTYVGTVGETFVDLLDVSVYRNIVVAARASGGGSASVVIKIYACDSTGNATGASAILTLTLATWTTTTYTLAVISEMGGATTNATYPPTAATAGQIIAPFGNHIKITETPTFTSGTTTLSLEIGLKG